MPPNLPRRDVLRAALAGVGLGGVAGTGSAQEGTRHTVDMTDSLVFEPDSITIAPGDTVVWENVGTIGHSVTAYEDDIPAEATYFASGGFDAEGAARSAYSVGDPSSGDIPGGESYEHTFEVEGSYDYFCIPHEGVGMLGSVEVTPGGASEGGGYVTIVPDAARDLVVAGTGSVLAVLSLAYVFMKYGGGEYVPTGGEDERE